MPIQLIQLGVPTVIAAGVTYALPARRCFVHGITALQVSLDNSAWSADVPASISPLGMETAAPFVRSTAGTTVIAKAV